jgi:hypothetical protein
MTRRLMKICSVVSVLAASTISGAEDVQWIRATVLLETGKKAAQRTEQTLVPGGVYSLADVEGRGLPAIDGEIAARVRRVGESMHGIEDSMRLATLIARQYYLRLEVGKKAALPIVDLNPRIGIVFEPQSLGGDRAICKVQFLEREGIPNHTEFTGDPITLRLQDADLRAVLATFSKITPFTIEIEPSIAGTVSVDLRDVPWDQALDLVLRTNNLGWEKDGQTLRVAPLEEMSGRKRVRTEATISLRSGSHESATIASRGDEYNPTAVVIVENVGGPPDLVAERDGLVHPTRVLLARPTDEDLEGSEDDLAIFRATVTTEGTLRDVAVLASPSSAFAERLAKALESWTFSAVLDEQGRKHEAVVGYGVRFRPQRVLASISVVERVGVDVEAAPAPSEYPGRYLVTVIVTDLDSGQVISAPKITARTGEEATVRSAFTAPSGDPAEFKLSLMISNGGKAVRYSWRLVSEGKVLSEHRAEFKL